MIFFNIHSVIHIYFITFDRSNKNEDACELYVKAANLFKMAKKWTQAGQAFVKSAELNLEKGDAKHDAASNYVEAATCYRKTDARLAVECLQKAAEIYTDMVYL